MCTAPTYIGTPNTFATSQMTPVDLSWVSLMKLITRHGARLTKIQGPRQENWFYSTLINSNKRGAAWRIIGSQIVFSRLNQSAAYGEDTPLNYDSWDGYQANKNRTFNTLYQNGIGNNIMLAGDSVSLNTPTSCVRLLTKQNLSMHPGSLISCGLVPKTMILFLVAAPSASSLPVVP